MKVLGGFACEVGSLSLISTHLSEAGGELVDVLVNTVGILAQEFKANMFSIDIGNK